MRLLFISFLFFVSAASAQTESPAEAPVQSPAPAVPQNEARWRFGVGGSLGIGNKLVFNDVTASNISGSAKTEFEFKAGVSLEAEARYMAMNSWGFMAGLTLDGEKSADRIKVTSGGTTLTGTADSSTKIQTTVIYANAVYRWHQFYLPFGLNLSSVKFTPASTFVGTSSVSGGLGAQLGVGYYLTDHFVMEAASRVVAVKLTSTSGGTTVDYGTGFLSSLMITGKYLF